MSDHPFNNDRLDDKRWDWFEKHLDSKTRGRLYHEAYKILRNPKDAEDALSIAFLHAVCNLHQLKSEDRFYPWLFTIVRRDAHLMRKKLARNVIVSYRYSIDRTSTEYSPELRVIEDESKRQLHEAIAQLKSPEKEIVVLRNWRGLSLLQIAKMLGLNYHTTRSKYTRALAMIRNRLTDKRGDNKDETI